MLNERTTRQETTADEDDAWFSAWRRRELSRIERDDIAYLDFTGAALYPESLVLRDATRIAGTVLGNPHSQSAPSQRATADIDLARRAILEFLNADPTEYAVILTPNASGACRLVGESFPFVSESQLVLTQDNHNSVNGIREYARAKGAQVQIIELDRDLRLSAPDELCSIRPAAPSLLAYPAQSNFSGVRHPLSLIESAQATGWRVLLDAASFLSSSDLDLRITKPDFVCLSLYKIAGYPTGLGALVARHDALAELRRPTFAGGSVQWVSVQHGRHSQAAGAEGFEDGTPAYLAAGAVVDALNTMRSADRPRLRRHLGRLTESMVRGLTDSRHPNGAPRAIVHGPHGKEDRGATVAFTLYDPTGHAIQYWDVENEARNAGIALRGGCFCNPGCAERAFGMSDRQAIDCLDRLGASFTVPSFAACLNGRTVGALRASLGCGTTARDIERLLHFVARYAVHAAAA